ncbi:MAG: flippase [Chloroflexi bacterium]|nr:flippase [Chloroflexota bacterium]
MSAVRRIAKNAALLYASRIMSTALKFVLFIYIARTLGDVTLGKFTFAIVFTTFFSILIPLGLDDLLVRDVSRDKTAAAKYLGNIAALRLFLSAIAFILMVTVIYLMDYPDDTRLAVAIFGGYAVFTAFSSLFRANFRAFEHMEWDAMLETLESVVTASVGIFLLFHGFGLIALSLTFLAAAAMNLIISFALCSRRFTRPRLQLDASFLRTSLKAAIPFYISMLFILYSRVDTVLLSALKGDAVVGVYNAAYQIVLAYDQFILTFMIAIVPVISRLYVSSRTMLQVAYEKSFKYLVIVGFPVSIGGMVLAEKLIPFLYGTEFDESVLILRILIWGCILSSMNRPMLFMLGAVNRQGTGALIAISAMLASFGINYLVIPRWSYLGSGATALIIGSLVTLAGWYAISRYAYKLPIARIILKPLAASLVMGALLYAGLLMDTNLLILIGLGAVSYVLVLHLIRVFSTDDYFLFREAFRTGGQRLSRVRSAGP